MFNQGPAKLRRAALNAVYYSQKDEEVVLLGKKILLQNCKKS